VAVPLIDRLLDEAVANQAAAGVVALAADEGGVFYQGARGRIGPDVATPIALDSIFRIASMTKAITATAAMQLVEAMLISTRRSARSRCGTCSRTPLASRATSSTRASRAT
jgi:methyl acetate hydrolase